MFEIKSYKGTYTVEFVEHIPNTSTKGDIFVIDSRIYDLYYKDSVFDNSYYLVDATEESKTLCGVQNLIDFLVDNGFKRNNRIIAIGGGVIQDLVSFTSSILYRGVNWEFYPTTLLSQCDSCIGSKTSINYGGVKNILGGFHPPKRIHVNRMFLNTLPDSEIKSGVGEMLHYFILNHKLDISEKMVNDCDLIANIEEYISESLAIKKEMIEKDEFDQGERNLFNFGHTFGHAIESVSEYRVNHGQAVTSGMYMACMLSLKLDLIDQSLFDRVENILVKNMSDYKIEDVEGYIQSLKKDKKNVSDMLTCILLTENYGTNIEISYDEVVTVLTNMYTNIDRYKASTF